MTEPSDHCPECGMPVEFLRYSTGSAVLPLHRNSFGKHCPASGKSLTHLRHVELLQAIFGVRK